MDLKPVWLHNQPRYRNLRINPGLRHPSRLFSKPGPFKKPKDPNPDTQLKLVRNRPDVDPQLLVYLTNAKNCFTIQLPEMGANYITRLVFDMFAETVFVLYKGYVRAAITFRLFFEEEFVEIAFCAVNAAVQFKGYGKLAMNYLKTAIQSYPMYDIITCADNGAIGFFKKQGFGKQINMDPDRWQRRIKDYEKITLMHCRILENINYLYFTNEIARQKQLLETKIGKHYVMHPSAVQNAYHPFAEAPTFANTSLQNVLNMTSNKLDSDDDYIKLKNYERKIEKSRLEYLTILTNLISNNEFEIFQRPVTEEVAQKYFDYIKRPMDFSTIKRRLLFFPDYYKTKEQFKSDIYQIVDNCKIFNSDNAKLIKLANNLKKEFDRLYFTIN